MSLLHTVLEAVAGSRGQLHILELGATIGLLAATLCRGHRDVAAALLAICTGFVALQAVVPPTVVLGDVGFRVASYPLHFLLPMYVMAFITLALDQAGWELVRHEAPAEVADAMEAADEDDVGANSED